jgi:nucleotide-binding universal stress UspA family protein
MFTPHVILHPTDFSDSSNYALQIAADLARQNDAVLFILHVAESLGAENATFGEVTSELEPESYRRRLEDDLRRSVPPPEGVRVQYLLAEGSPGPAIADAARRHEADLIVMGTHAPANVLSRLFTGSVADEVIHVAPCPVLVTRLPGRHGANAQGTARP